MAILQFSSNPLTDLVDLLISSVAFYHKNEVDDQFNTTTAGIDENRSLYRESYQCV